MNRGTVYRVSNVRFFQLRIAHKSQSKDEYAHVQFLVLCVHVIHNAKYSVSRIRLTRIHNPIYGIGDIAFPVNEKKGEDLQRG